MGHAYDGIFFFAEIAKLDHQLSESFYFIVFQILFQILIQ